MPLKPTDKPQFSKKWWTTGKPADIKGADLEKALQILEKVLADEKKKSDAEALQASADALDSLEAAIDKLVDKECDKKKHKDLLTVLDKFDGLIKSERKRLEDAQGGLEDDSSDDSDSDDEDSDEEEDEGKLFEKDFLYKMIKILRSSGKALNFGFGLNTSTPEQSQLLLKRKGKPEILFKALKKTGKYSNRCLVCGTALADPEDGKVLMLNVEEGDEPPQILKLGRKFLRGDKALKFRKLKLVIGGKTLVDNDPDEEDSAGAGSPAELQSRVRSATAAAGTWTRTADSVAEQIESIRSKLNAYGDAEARSVSDGLSKMVDKFPKLDFTSLVGAADAATFDRSLNELRTTVGQWRRLLAGDPALQAIDKNPFISTNVAGTYNEALTSISGELKL